MDEVWRVGVISTAANQAMGDRRSCGRWLVVECLRMLRARVVATLQDCEHSRGWIR